MPNSYYNHGGYPAAGAPGSSAAMRAELDSVTAGFDRLPALGGNAGAIVVVNASANGLTTSAGGLDDSVFAIFDNLDNTKIGKFQLSGLTTGQTRTLTWPDANTVIVGTDVLQTLSNKTLTNPTINAATLSGTFAGNPTFGGNVIVTGSSVFNDPVTINDITTHSAAVNVTAASGALNILAGNAAQNGYFTIGRTAVESAVGISGGASQLVTGDVAGDFSIRNSSGRILFASGGFAPQVWINTAGLGVGIAPTSPLHAVLTESVAYNAANMFAAASTLATLRNLSTTNGTYGAIRLEATGAGSNAVTAIAAVHTGDGASALTFGTRTNAAGSVVERGRFDNTGRFVVGTTSATYRIQAASIDADLLGLFRDLDVTSSGSAGTNLDFGARNGATFTPGARVLGALENPPTGGFLALYTRTAGAMTEKVRVDNAGRTGLGRIPTIARLEVSGRTTTGYAIDEGVRIVHNDAYISFYDTAESVRSGYIQMTSAGVASWVNNVGGVATTSISVGGSTRLSIDNTGITNIAAGSGFLRMGGNVTRTETNHGIVAINAAFASVVHRRPDSIRVTLECLTAEAGYSVGQHVDWQPMRPGFTGGWWSFSNVAGTQMTVQTLNATIQLPNLAGGAATNITPANWNIRTYYLFL